jgi:hypothetical protein
MPKRSTRDIVDRLLQTMTAADGSISTREVAKRSGVEWKTAARFLSYFSRVTEAGRLTKKTERGVTLWSLDAGKRFRGAGGGLEALFVGPRGVSESPEKELSVENVVEALSKPTRGEVLAVIRK